MKTIILLIFFTLKFVVSAVSHTATKFSLFLLFGRPVQPRNHIISEHELFLFTDL